MVDCASYLLMLVELSSWLCLHTVLLTGCMWLMQISCKSNIQVVHVHVRLTKSSVKKKSIQKRKLIANILTYHT